MYGQIAPLLRTSDVIGADLADEVQDTDGVWWRVTGVSSYPDGVLSHSKYTITRPTV